MPPSDMMAAMSSNPGMMDSAMSMMRNMDEGSLRSMLLSSGMCKDEAQAQGMAAQFKGMSDTQMKMMLKAANVVQGGARAVQRVREFVLSRTALMLALAVVLLAVLLRHLGIM